MTNKNEFDTPDNFSTNDHVFYGDEKKGKMILRSKMIFLKSLKRL